MVWLLLLSYHFHFEAFKVGTAVIDAGTCHVWLIRQTQNLGLKFAFFMMPRSMRPSPSRKVARHLLTSEAFIVAIPVVSASTRRQHMKMKKADYKTRVPSNFMDAGWDPSSGFEISKTKKQCHQSWIDGSVLYFTCPAHHRPCLPAQRVLQPC